MPGQNDRLARFAAEVPPVNPIVGRDERRPLAERMAAYTCPGVGVCVVEDGRIVDAAGFGATTPGGPPVDSETLFSGASISKPLAATLAMQLVEAGALDLDEPVNGRLRAWRVPENDFTRAVPVTLRHLLCHKAGVTVHGFGAYPEGEPAPTLLDVLEGRPPSPTGPVVVDKLPGASVRYSGGGTQIVQLLLEETSGRPFADLARERIFERLGMEATTFVQPLPRRFRGRTAVGHGPDGAPVPGLFVFTPQLAAGGVYTTAKDYALFMIECRRAFLGLSTTLLGQAAAAAMLTRQAPGAFGLGWELFGEGAQLRFGHGGSNAGYQCSATLSLAKGFGAVVLTNALLGAILHQEVMNGLAAAYAWEGFLKPPREVVPVPPAEQDRYIGRYAVVSGLDAPHLDIWSEEGRLMSRVEGLIFPPRPIHLGRNGRFFNQQTPAETEVSFGADGRVKSLRIIADGEVELFRAERRDAPP